MLKSYSTLLTAQPPSPLMLKAINPSLEIHAEDILDIANQMQQHPAIDSSSSITLSQMDANSNTPDHSWQSKLTPKTSRGPSSPPLSNSIDKKPE
ncbi:hypothetical protein O181_062468 [Austropuccinia psidii MF-1]|uniref:Uncharacterized protein n=1 Tax=Austropuccinia psidii MF-1 TaxID=1389203 RepID=A0A9Q3EJR3_9BASI|nr:hypothetical protein [Austropuccinia psidii MF-1]